MDLGALLKSIVTYTVLILVLSGALRYITSGGNLENWMWQQTALIGAGFGVFSYFRNRNRQKRRGE